MSSNIILLGPFPPPLHGMSLINQRMSDELAGAGHVPVVLSTSAPGLSRHLLMRATRAGAVAKAFAGLLTRIWRRRYTLYISLSGGYGQIYETIFAVAARLFSCKLFVHHHCYAYLDKHSPLTGLFVFIAGPHATHICLSQAMAERLQTCYGVKRVIALSNSAFMPSPLNAAKGPRTKLGAIGFLSNIAEEKGILLFLDLCELLSATRTNFSAYIAGPFQDDHVRDLVLERLQRLPSVKYMGPVYGQRKEEFFECIDLLVFPTIYRNEAEPLTIHEALSHSVPVIAYARGAIGEILDDSCGKAIDVNLDFVAEAMKLISQWVVDPARFRDASLAAHSRFAQMRSQHLSTLATLVASMASPL